MTKAQIERLKEGINSDTVSKKFFQMLLDTLEDFESDEEADLSDDDRARIMATLLNAEAKKYCKPAMWKDVIGKLSTKHGVSGSPQPVEPAPSAPSSPFGGNSLGRFGERRGSIQEAAPSVEFYTDPDTGSVKARVGSKETDLKTFIKSASEYEDVSLLIKALQSKIASEGYDPNQDFKTFISKYLSKKDETPDVLVRRNPSDPNKVTAQFDDNEIKKAKDNNEFFANALGELDEDIADLRLRKKLIQELLAD